MVAGTGDQLEGGFPPVPCHHSALCSSCDLIGCLLTSKYLEQDIPLISLGLIRLDVFN